MLNFGLNKGWHFISNANEYKIFIPVGELGDTLIQRTNPILRKRFCEIFLESIKELDENEIIIIDSSELPIISLDLNTPIEYPPKYHSNHFTYRSLRRIDPNEYVGLNNAECRKYIESCKSAAKRHSIQTANFF